MGELGELRNRVDQAVERLSAANDSRRRQSRGLTMLLGDLEAKYEARSEELDHCKRRIEALTRENADLSGLIDNLVRIVDTTVSTQDEDALFRASAMASDLVGDWSGADHGEAPEADATEGGAPVEDGEDPVAVSGEEDDEGAAAGESALDGVAAAAVDDQPVDRDAAVEAGHHAADDALAGLGPEMRFEDVSDEELLGEPLDGDPEDLAAILDTPLTPDLDGEDSSTTATDSEPFDEIFAQVDDAAALIETAIFDAADTDLTGVDAIPLDDADEPDPVREMLAADLDIPEIVIEDHEPISRVDPDEDTESSIRALMARLEEAAERAKARDDVSPGSAAVADEAPAPAAGGAG